MKTLSEIKIANIVGWLSITLLVLLSHRVRGIDYLYNQDNRQTTISFQNQNRIEGTVLDSSFPTSKIVIKLAGIDYLNDQDYTSQYPVPEFSAVRQIRLIPYNKNTLLVLKLLNPVKYKFSIVGRRIEIVLQDSVYRDPLNYHYFKGVFLQRIGKFKAALSHYRKAAFSNRKHSHAYYKAGQIRLEWKQYRKAEINFKKAVQNGCDSTGLYQSLAKLYRIKGNLSLADNYQQKYDELIAAQKKIEAQQASAYLPDTLSQPLNSNQDTAKKEQPETRSLSAPLNKDKSQAYSFTTVPEKILFYFLGSVILGLALFVWAIFQSHKRYQAKKLSKKQIGRLFQSDEVRASLSKQEANHSRTWSTRSNQQNLRNELGDSDLINVQEKTQRLIELARSQDREDPDTEALIKNLLEKKDSFQFPEAEKPVDEEQAYTQTSPSPLDETEASPTERTKQLAKKLSLGTGEIELALNLSAHHHYATHDRDDLRSRILQLNNQNFSVQEISRQLNLGQSEVELFLRLAQKTRSAK